MLLTRKQMEENFVQTQGEYECEELGGMVGIRRPPADHLLTMYAELKDYLNDKGELDTEEHENNPEFARDVMRAYRPVLENAVVDGDGVRVFEGEFGQQLYDSLDVSTLTEMIAAIPQPKKKVTRPPKKRKHGTKK